VHRVAVRGAPLPSDVHEVVGHGKVFRNRSAPLLRDIALALYEDGPRESMMIVDIPGGGAERRTTARRFVAWMVRVVSGDDVVFAYTREVSRGGAFLEHVEPIAPGKPLRIEVIADDVGLQLDSELVRQDASGTAVRWVGPADMLERLERLLLS